jgi:hypothetical protein
MQIFKLYKTVLVVVVLLVQLNVKAQDHPNLILTKTGVEQIRQNLGKVPFFDARLAEVIAEVDAEILTGIHVPIPKDMAGGYTHDRHKKNFSILQKAGALYQILEDDTYAAYTKEVLMEYARIYKDLPIHPQPRSYARGKIFWQCLNDANWLVYVSQAYDCIHPYLSKKERKHLEKNLFRPFADYISIQNPQYFNRIHNHSTWGSAAVGMIGLVMQDEELIQRALYGLKQDGIDENAKDNDGGFIKKADEKAGFLANIDAPFSPEGYYTEAPYYQRYAMYPYLLFAVGLNNMRPQEKIFDYNNGVLLKAVNTLLNLTDTDGEFYPLNDAQKGMSYFSRELVSSVDIAYHYGDKNPGLLSIANAQGKITLDDAGFAVALAIEQGKAVPFSKQSFEITDGPKGKQGGITILRAGNVENELNLVSKYTAQGNSHGHYDKLSFSLYYKGDEVLQDYGLARFVNIDQKNGGGYLKENKTWAKQTIAHNTLVVNETSHFKGKYELGSQFHSTKYVSELSSNGHQLISAKENNAYEGVKMHRTLVMVEDERFENPLILDVFKVDATKGNRYDLPYHYFGQIMSNNFFVEPLTTLTPLGEKQGYQHLWLMAQAKATSGLDQLSWFSNNTFHTLSMASQAEDTYLFAKLGANDPEFNLRDDPAFIIRRENAANTLFVNAIETHGSYSPVTEIAKNTRSLITGITIEMETEAYSVISISLATGPPVKLYLANNNQNNTQSHSVNIDGVEMKWTGPYFIQTN